MILFEEEKSKLLLGGMHYLRPLYIKGVLSMYEILSISWKESLIDLKNKFENLKSNKEKSDKSNYKDNEIKELNNKMFLIFSFMNHFYQMINKGKLKKFEGLDFIYSKLNNFFTLCRKIISYKILDINLEEFNQTKIILKLIIHVKLFLIFCEYDTYESKEEFIKDLFLSFNPKEILNEVKTNNNDIETKEDNINLNNNTNKEKEELVIQNLIKEIKAHNISLDNINLYIEKIYNSLTEKYKNFINYDKFTFLTILYENYFELNSKEEEKENSDEDNENKNNEQSTNKKKKKRKKNKKKKNKNKEKNEDDIKFEDNEAKNEIIIEENNTNEIKNEYKTKEKEKEKEESEEIKNNKIARINEKITMIKTIQSIAKMTNKLINNMSFTENYDQENQLNPDNKISLSQNKTEFDEIKKKFLEPLIPYINQYKKIHGNKKMSILSLLQCAFIVYQEKYRKEKEKLMNEIENLKKAMNHMFIQIQLMGGGRDIFKNTLYYLILIYIPEEQNNPSFFSRVQKLINFFEQKVNNDLNLIKNMTSDNNINNKLPCENINLIINRLHKNSQYVLFIKSIFFMFKFFDFIHFNKNQNEKNKNNKDIIKKENEIDGNIFKDNPQIIKEKFSEEEKERLLINEKKNVIYPNFNFKDCYSSYASFLDEIVTNEKTQSIMGQVIQKIEEENNLINEPKFDINNLFIEKEGKKVFNLTGFDVQIIIHDIKKIKYKEETLENLVNSKTWDKSQQEV